MTAAAAAASAANNSSSSSSSSSLSQNDQQQFKIVFDQIQAQLSECIKRNGELMSEQARLRASLEVSVKNAAAAENDENNYNANIDIIK